MDTLIDYQALARRFDHPASQAIVLMGSHARGEAGPYSDVDLVRFLAEPDTKLIDSGSHLLDGILVVVSDATPTDVETWFTRPEKAVSYIAGLRSGRSLLERAETFAQIQARAAAFTWDDHFQLLADVWASEQMVGWIEEAHKGLEGLRRGDVGRLLNGLFGLTYGLSHVMQVQRGVLLAGDNSFYDAVAQAIGPASRWTELRGIAFGVTEVHGRPPSLRERVVAGLGLYVATAELLGDALQPEQAPLIQQTVQLIQERLESAYHGES